METLNQILTWLNANESAFSAAAAIIAIIAAFVVVLSPLGSGIRTALSGKGSSTELVDDSQQREAIESAPTSRQAIPNRLSVAVLPFQNLSDDKEQEYIADGLTEDLITDLSQDSRLFVIARNSTYGYKNTAPDIREVGRELGVRYVVEGSLRRMGDKLRITAQLIEADSGSHVWADKIDRPFDEFFAAQDDITKRIVTALCSHLNIAEKSRLQRQSPESLEAWELCVRAETNFQGLSPDTVKEGLKLAHRATQLEPGFAHAWALSGFFQSAKIMMGLSDDPNKDAAEAIAMANRALQLNPTDAIVMAYRGATLVRAGQPGEGLNQLSASLERNPNYAMARFFSGSALVRLRRPEEALVELDQFLRQNPKAPELHFAYFWRAIAYGLLKDFVQAEVEFRRSIELYPVFHPAWLGLGHMLQTLGRDEEARLAIDEARRIVPGLTLETVLKSYKGVFDPMERDRAEKNIRQIWVD